ncbi:Uncharacterised protein [Mycobacteroides abscessus subsp. abscessus]|uniref:hypothetical protein n=1 Tax=Mycobacteroides abscessus TaxID=36809 RepID=UPI0009274652|nr:hypothetical protein [Mycobacteroides abscessus]SHV92115.1 Uncharacterised protein [Mycobacteroides abscessus subsp. abscessus]SHW15098.1 Uncharacterised protein [Mycobacteroides abscessus subsp. abscessus]SHW41547.1 Uncharacterised protein [Mycobacteroides abscessus subsp. abscessus]SIA97418.1 Uncharacterised protein [Mycobacteroides abscessus subsp. abscessus]SIB35315.1 Uncharacterised protein [Mycobacteroides abscessus subsp. abscessus]
MNPHDPASDIVNEFINAMKKAFNPADSVQPPLGGGSKDVRFFAGDGPLPLSVWDPEHGPATGCKQPLLWVRVDRRYRSRRSDFPAAYVAARDCKTADVVRALAVEIGIARCADMSAKPKWPVLESEAEISLDDSFRIETALCLAATALTKPDRAVATDTIAPQGPEGGLIAWTGMAYVSL